MRFCAACLHPLSTVIVSILWQHGVLDGASLQLAPTIRAKLDSWRRSMAVRGEGGCLEQAQMRFCAAFLHPFPAVLEIFLLQHGVLDGASLQLAPMIRAKLDSWRRSMAVRGEGGCLEQAQMRFCAAFLHPFPAVLEIFLLQHGVLAGASLQLAPTIGNKIGSWWRSMCCLRSHVRMRLA